MKKLQYLILLILSLALSLSMTAYKIQSEKPIIQQGDKTYEQEVAEIKKELTRY
ncbi:MAG: hypothetical protein HQK91_00320 [Nitrospirae bacterium]|nr:hypothetical protein [Nitrospirota bacterium]MBF0539880.1 hypothetical protein [Nitrospirota bacterium]